MKNANQKIEVSAQVKSELANVKSLFERATYHADKQQEQLAAYYEARAVTNCAIYMVKLGITYNEVIDLAFDFEYSLQQINERRA